MMKSCASCGAGLTLARSELRQKSGCWRPESRAPCCCWLVGWGLPRRRGRLRSFGRTCSKSRGGVATTAAPRQSSRLPPVRGSLHALAIGISNYNQKQFSLGFGRADAEAFRDLVNHQRGQLFQNADAVALVDEQATEDGIRNGLQQLRKSVVQFDLAIILLAGHGLTDENGNYFFVPYDFDHTKNFGTTCISWNDLSQEIRSMPCKVLIVLDTCHSGLATRMGLLAVVATSTATASASRRSKHSAIQRGAW